MGGGLSVGINIFLGVMTGMQRSNQRGLIWGPVAGPGMRLGCGNNGCTNGVSWIPHWWIMRSWDVGAVVCCVWSETYMATHRNRVIDLVFDTLSHGTGQLTGSWIALLCCRRRGHIKQQSGTHIYHRATSHTCSHDSCDRDKTRSHLFCCLICMIWTVSGSH